MGVLFKPNVVSKGKNSELTIKFSAEKKGIEPTCPFLETVERSTAFSF
ncbi:hypothetical protein J6TS1_07930 [Siminovitchia terrae]|uniref:Uncharacterized protein n=1 Tax=Siminovitchia terrae TaxID=1914933 RepID=A0ABQ4KSB1_SIMTE|nr:hypothetical protein J6TS1_07930 [Siminovitchia terrae]